MERASPSAGFRVLWFIIPDDTVHEKNDQHHAILRTGISTDGKPQFIVLTLSVTITPKVEGKADLNQLAIEENVEPTTLSHGLAVGLQTNIGSAFYPFSRDD